MADEDRRNDGPSLELPSLGFGRRKRRKQAEDTAPDQPEAVPSEPVEAGTTQPLAAQREPAVEPAPEPASPAPVTREDVPTAATPPPVLPDAEPVAEETRPLFVDQAPASPLAPPPRVPANAPEPETEAEEPPAPRRRKRREPREPRERRQLALPAVGGMTAAVVTGVLVGVITVGLTWASLNLCEVVKGTSSCGGPGFLLLVAIMVAMVLLGAVLLRAFGVPDPGSTSFLAVGLLAVVALLFLVDVLFNWWMIIVVPACAVATFALSHWVTTAFIEPAKD